MAYRVSQAAEHLASPCKTKEGGARIGYKAQIIILNNLLIIANFAHHQDQLPIVNSDFRELRRLQLSTKSDNAEAVCVVSLWRFQSLKKLNGCSWIQT